MNLFIKGKINFEIYFQPNNDQWNEAVSLHSKAWSMTNGVFLTITSPYKVSGLLSSKHRSWNAMVSHRMTLESTRWLGRVQANSESCWSNSSFWKDGEFVRLWGRGSQLNLVDLSITYITVKIKVTHDPTKR